MNYEQIAIIIIAVVAFIAVLFSIYRPMRDIFIDFLAKIFAWIFIQSLGYGISHFQSWHGRVLTEFVIMPIMRMIIKQVKKNAKTVYQQSKGTPAEEIAGIVNHEVQKWEGNQELMTQAVEDVISAIEYKLPHKENEHIYDKMGDIRKEKDLVKQLQKFNKLILLIPQITGGVHMTGDYVEGDKIKIEGVQGDVIGVGAKITGNGIIGKNIGEIKINQRQLAKIPNEYAKSLQAFSEAVNAQLKKHNISQEKTAPVQESLNELVKEVDIKTDETIDIEKKEDIKDKIKKVAIRLLKILPEGAETVATFTPLAPFSKIIGKGVEEIVKEFQK